MKSAVDPRHNARILALQSLFTQEFQEREKVDTQLIDTSDLMELEEIDNFNQELYDRLLEGVKTHRGVIDELIKRYAPEWPINQIKKIDLQILRIAIFEGFIDKITPPKVAIDEAVELGKEYGADTSSKFVNGVLGAIYEEVKKDQESSQTAQ